MTGSAATLSPCGRYRYDLTRRWGDGPLALWVMLNPSTADADVDDPTIRRVAGFTRSWGMPGFTVVNLFALRATDPEQLMAVDGPTAVGPDNALTIRSHLLSAHVVVAAWGAHRATRRVERSPVLLWAEDAGRRVYCLGRTKGHAPRHPLYVRGDQQLVPYT